MNSEIENQVKRLIERESKILGKLSDSAFMDWNLSILSEINSKLGYYQYINESSINILKNRFYNTGIIDIYLTENFYKSHSRFLDFDLPRCLIPVLSDHEKLIQRYSKLRYQKGENAELSMDEMISEGELPIWCNTVQNFMINNISGVERNLNIIELKTLKKLTKKEEGLKDDLEFYKALLSGDKNKIEEIIEKLTSPKIHLKRNDNPVLNKFISQPALGYAKLAYRNGIPINVNSPLVPKDILPVQPLNHYKIRYEFLKGN